MDSADSKARDGPYGRRSLSGTVRTNADSFISRHTGHSCMPGEASPVASDGDLR